MCHQSTKYGSGTNVDETQWAKKISNSVGKWSKIDLKNSKNHFFHFFCVQKTCFGSYIFGYKNALKWSKTEKNVQKMVNFRISHFGH